MLPASLQFPITQGRGLHPDGAPHFLFSRPYPSKIPKLPVEPALGPHGPRWQGPRWSSVSSQRCAVRPTEPASDRVVGRMVEASPAAFPESPGQVNVGGFGLRAKEFGFGKTSKSSQLSTRLDLGEFPATPWTLPCFPELSGQSICISTAAPSARVSPAGGWAVVCSAATGWQCDALSYPPPGCSDARARIP